MLTIATINTNRLVLFDNDLTFIIEKRMSKVWNFKK